MKNRLQCCQGLAGLFVVFVVLGSYSYGQSGSDALRKLELLRAYPDMILVNGKLYTMDGNLRQAQALAVRNNRILAMGTDSEIRFLAGPNTQVIDAKGRAVLPALIDAHTHPNLGAVAHWLGAKGPEIAKEFNLPEFASVQVKGTDTATVLRGLEQAARRRASELGSGKWIVVWALGGNNLEESNKTFAGIWPSITPEFLDTIAPNNPMIVFNGPGWLGPVTKNTRASEEWIRIVGEDQTQTLMVKPHFLWEILLRGRDNVATEIMKRELLECVAAQGLGTFGDRYDRATASARAFRLLYERGEMPVRWGYYVTTGSNLVNQKYALLKPYNETTLTDFFTRIFPKEIPDLRGIGNDYIWYAGTANEGWEGGVGCTRAEPLPGAASTGFNLFADCKEVDPEKSSSYQTVRAALESGLRVSFLHGMTDGTYDALFRMIDKAIADGKVTLEQVRQMRISTEHNMFIRPEQVSNFAKYNISPSFEGFQIRGGGFLKAYGEHRMNWLVPVKSLIQSGVRVVHSTDSHLKDLGPEWKSMGHPDEWSGNYWAFMEFFTTRRFPNDDVTYNSKEVLDKVTLMKASTIWGAEQLLNEKNIGSLEVGKLADFVVIDKDFFAIPEDQIHTIKTLLTVVGGKTVFKASDF